MNITPKISVIVPVYNTEKYLHRCIDSILSQTFTDFELLLIDDGSKDSSGAICDEYAAKDSRVRVFHKENGGVTVARALGVSMSKARYITFVDSDDYLFGLALHSLYSAFDENVDLVIGQHAIDGNNTAITNVCSMTPEQYQHAVFQYYYSPWAKLYKKDYLRKFVFELPRDIVHGEDAIMNLRIAFSLKKKVKVIDKFVYNYTTNIESVCNTFITNLKYESCWYDYMLKSIPEDKLHAFMDECILLRLKNRGPLLDFYIKNNIWHKIQYHKTLEHDIMNSNYKLKTGDKFFLMCHNPITCSLFNILAKICDNLKNVIK
ncbi:MAG: glycosyltransferase [Clostridia bacterium]|nr:glycosyltransferase [Clostridia bacterium]